MSAQIKPSVEQILQLEAQIWKALKLGDPDLDAKFLTEDFVGVYPSGFWNKQAHCDQLKNGPLIAEFRFTDERLVYLSEDQVLLAYRAHYSWVQSPDRTEQMLITSLWTRCDGEWKNSFSQDTPAAL